MSDLFTFITAMRRPRLLIRAARFGMKDYHRDRDLKRLIGKVAAPESAIKALIGEEERLEETRRKGDAAYSVLHHVEVLIALLGELRLLPKPSTI